MTPQQYLDTLGIWEATAGLPEQIDSAIATSSDVLDATALPPATAIRAVVIFGMGSGGLVGDAMAAFGADRSSVPIVVGNGYASPAFVGPHTLAFVVSYSGDTDETCAAATTALEQGARVVVVSGGGALAKMAQASDLTLFDVRHDLPASRTAFGALTMPVLMTLARVGIIPDVASTLDGTLSSLRSRRDALLADGGPAEEVARIIGRTIPLIYGSTGLTGVAARRWKTQVNENAKTPAFWAVQPELSHNEVAGWGQHGDVTRQVFSLITLRHAGEHPRVARRYARVIEATDEVMANVIPVWAEGDDDLARFLDLTLFGDFVSLHMAGREGIDPGPTPALSDVESALLA